MCLVDPSISESRALVMKAVFAVFKTFPFLVLHVVSHLVAVLLLRVCGGSLPVAHTAVLEYLRISAVLYYYRLADRVSCAYAGVGMVRHWEVVTQQILGECLLLVQYPVVLLVLVLSAIIAAGLRYGVLICLVREGTAGRDGAGRDSATAPWVRAVADGMSMLANLLLRLAG